MTAVVVDESLGQHGAQPCGKRAAAVIAAQGRLAPAVLLTQAVEIGVERVGQVAGLGIGAGQPVGGLIEGGAVGGHEALPGRFPAFGAGVGQHQVVDAELAEEANLLARGGKR